MVDPLLLGEIAPSRAGDNLCGIGVGQFTQKSRSAVNIEIVKIDLFYLVARDRDGATAVVCRPA
jgi:hypothetical protein